MVALARSEHPLQELARRLPGVQVEIADASDAEALPELHERAHHLCFIANSVNFDVRCEPRHSVRPR